jgi:hypothetical protein
MALLNVRELLDYCRCPMYYKLKHIDKRLPTKQLAILDQFSREIKKMVYYYYNMIQDGRVPTPAQMSRKWGQIWTKKRLKQEIVFAIRAQKDMKRNMETRGIEVVLSLLDYFAECPGYPIAVGYEYKIPFFEDTLEGTIDLIREVDGKIETLIIGTDIGHWSKWGLNPIEPWTTAYAVKHILAVPTDRLAILNIIYLKEQEVTFTEADFQSAHHYLRTIKSGIDSKIFFPTLNRNCMGCGYQYVCKRQSWFKEDINCLSEQKPQTEE